jgi:hypothetical protein
MSKSTLFEAMLFEAMLFEAMLFQAMLFEAMSATVKPTVVSADIPSIKSTSVAHPAAKYPCMIQPDIPFTRAGRHIALRVIRLLVVWVGYIRSTHRHSITVSAPANDDAVIAVFVPAIKSAIVSVEFAMAKPTPHHRLRTPNWPSTKSMLCIGL